MSQRLTINQNNKPIYDIVYENDFSQLSIELDKFDISNKKLCIITDSKVNELYSNDVCNVLKDKCVSSLLSLISCAGTNKDEFLSLYSEFVSALYEKTDDLCEYINELLQNDENIYVKESAKGDASPLMQKAAESELDLFQKLSQISCDDIKMLCDTDIYLPQWKNGNISIKDEYIKKIASIKTTGYGIYATHHMFLYRDDYYNPDTDKKGISEVIISKQRSGSTGTIELVWLGQYTKFANKVGASVKNTPID